MMKVLSGPFWARLGILMLLFLNGIAPLHLAQEIHMALPASAQHHAEIHCEEERQVFCEKPKDDVSQPLSSEQHERHHEASCANDSAFLMAHWEHTLSLQPTHWHLVLLDFVPIEAPQLLAVPATPTRSRAPPDSVTLPPSPHFAFRSGLSPPILI